MGRAFDSITPAMREFIERQHMFFVATAPSGDGRVNMSPKGYDAFRILDDHRVCYLDLTGSGAETIAHVRDNGRITFMFCAFEGKPNICRLYGRAHVVRAGDAEFDQLRAGFGEASGVRSIIVADIDRTSNSCGFSVPFMDFVEERPTLSNHWDGKSEGELSEYWAKKNATSIDGLPAVEAK
jgi:hypothetical protein